MSDEAREGMDEEARGDDVEAHAFGAPVDRPIDSPIDAQEEPPDVEAHQLGGAPVDRPID